MLTVANRLKDVNGEHEPAKVKKPRKTVAEAGEKHRVAIAPIKTTEIRINLRGTAGYLQDRIPHSVVEGVSSDQEKGDKANSGKRKVKPPRDFEKEFHSKYYQLKKGVFGIPSAAFKGAIDTACVLADVHKTVARQTIQVIHDGYDITDGTPLVRISGKPQPHKMVGRPMPGQFHIRMRAMYAEWSVVLRLRFDPDVYSPTDIVNLVNRAGRCGIGNGRPSSPKSAGMGLGTWEVSV